MSTSNTPRPTKAERREAAREQARLLREAQARRERRNRLLLIGGLVAGVALIVVAVFAIIGAGSVSSLEDVDRPAGSDLSGGIVTGAEGVGSENAGAPEVRVYSDFMCPFCANFEELNGPMLDEIATAGEATVIYHPVAFLDRFSQGTEYSTRAAQAVAVVADAAPEQFVAFQAALFAGQPAENTPGLSDDEIGQIALQAGVPQEVVDTLADGRFTEWVGAATNQASLDLERAATPTVLIDGQAWEGDWRSTDALRAAIVGEGVGAEPSEVATTPAA
jgi:protein-disulfide isomerase